jgi:hypothetical protein
VSTDSRSRQPRRSNPLEGSSLLSSTPVEPPPLPAMPGTAPALATPALSEPQGQVAVEAVVQPSLLYTSRPSAQFMLRPFEQQHDRQTVYIDVHLAGALDALVQLVAHGNKTKLVDEMARDLIKKHERTLREHEDLVGLCEEKYRKKHHL